MVRVLSQTLEQHQIAEIRSHDHRPLATATAYILSLGMNHPWYEMTEALEPQPRFRGKPLNFQVVFPQYGTAVLKGLRACQIGKAVVGPDGLPAEVLKIYYPPSRIHPVSAFTTSFSMFG